MYAGNHRGQLRLADRQTTGLTTWSHGCTSISPQAKWVRYAGRGIEISSGIAEGIRHCGLRRDSVGVSGMITRAGSRRGLCYLC